MGRPPLSRGAFHRIAAVVPSLDARAARGLDGRVVNPAGFDDADGVLVPAAFVAVTVTT